MNVECEGSHIVQNDKQLLEKADEDREEAVFESHFQHDPIYGEASSDEDSVSVALREDVDSKRELASNVEKLTVSVAVLALSIVASLFD